MSEGFVPSERSTERQARQVANEIGAPGFKVWRDMRGWDPDMGPIRADPRYRDMPVRLKARLATHAASTAPRPSTGAPPTQ